MLLYLWPGLAEIIGWLLFLIAVSGSLGFWIVQSLIIWYDWINMTLTFLSPDYMWFWIGMAMIFMLFFGIPIWWIAVSLAKIVRIAAGFLTMAVGKLRKP